MTGLTKEELEDLWNDLFIEADRAKMLEETLLRLTAFYEALDSDDRNVANDVFRAWVLEGNPNQRFDALAMISKFKIRSALPELRADLARLRHETGPSVPFDLEQLYEIIAELEPPD